MRKHFMFKVLFTLVIGLFLSVGAFAQQIAVKGIVKDTTGEPVIGANVLVKGTTNGTITDFDGNFQLSANKGDIIVISFIGFTAQELPATAELMNVVLKDDSEMLSEVVVIGYGVAKKNDVTGSVTAMKPDEMNKGLVTNAQDMMQGKIAGVNVTSASGTPGAGAQIRIRGGSSLNASNDPLIVIDGLAMDNSGVQGLSNPLSMVNQTFIHFVRLHGCNRTGQVVLLGYTVTDNNDFAQHFRVVFQDDVHQFGCCRKFLSCITDE